MNKKIGITAAVAAAAAIVGAILFFWPPHRYNFSRVHPSIRNLKRPYQRVDPIYYLDGGSVGVEIVDRDGETLLLAFPVDWNPRDGETYHRLFVGATYCDFPGAVEVEFTEDTREYVAELIAQCPPGEERDHALLALRGSCCDYVGFIARTIMNGRKE